MTDFDEILHENLVAEVYEALRPSNSLLSLVALNEEAMIAVEALVQAGYIREPETCEWKSPNTDARCDDLAPLSKSYCAFHSN